jgi:ubiquinone/menaquinone biosynthesis C-methylase UbiE
MGKNIDLHTVEGFGDEWSRFNQQNLDSAELEDLFLQYFRIFPWHMLPSHSSGFDLGCGSGRWAKCVAPKAGLLYCIDASSTALAVAKKNLVGHSNCMFIEASVDNIPLDDDSMDFGYSLGVLHHVPDTAAGIKSCVNKLKPGAPLLIYLYYAFDNRPVWFRILWRLSDAVRKVISRSPFLFRYWISQLIALVIYFPLARVALFFEKIGLKVDSLPLSAYRHRSFYTMRTDALDRFGTRLEQRYTAEEISKMMKEAGLEKITFSDTVPFWCAVGFKKGSS